MLKKLSLLALAVLLLASCSGEKAADQTAAAQEMSIADFNAHAADLVDQTVVLTGTVDHVCHNSGKRLFIFGPTPQDRVKVESGPTIASFDVKLEGSDIRVTGKVLEMRIDEAYLDAWAKEEGGGEDCTADIQPGQEAVEQAAEAVTDDHAHAAEEMTATMKQIAGLRQQLADSGKDYLGFYSVECISFEEIKQES